MHSSEDRLANLMRKSLNGDAGAYTILLKETAALMRNFLARRLPIVGEVDDVLQEVLLSIHKARHTYDGCRPYEPWAYAIARYRLQDYLRCHYSDDLHHAEDLSLYEDRLPAISGVTLINYAEIENEIQLLPEKQAKILALIHKEGFTAKEAATKLGMKESAVKVAAHRAYKVLRHKLGGHS